MVLGEERLYPFVEEWAVPKQTFNHISLLAGGIGKNRRGIVTDHTSVYRSEKTIENRN